MKDMQALRLYELTDNYNLVANMLEDSDDKEALQDTLDALNDAIETKMENIVKLWKSKIGERDFIKAERFRLEEREKRLDKDAAWLLDYVEREMKRVGIDNVPSKLFTIKMQLNKPSVNVLDESLIPAEFMRITTTITTAPDKIAIMELLKAKQEIPGVAIKQEKSLRVR